MQYSTDSIMKTLRQRKRYDWCLCNGNTTGFADENDSVFNILTCIREVLISWKCATLLRYFRREFAAESVNDLHKL